MLIFSSDASAGHVTPPGHPEQVARLAVAARGLAGLGAEWRDCPVGDDADILRAHTAGHLEAIEAAAAKVGGGPEIGGPESGGLESGGQQVWAQVDADTFMAKGSLAAARRAVGGAVAAVDAVVSGAGRRAFVLARPPGHHATRSRAMGFCLLSTVAIAARRALDHHGLGRVAIVDFDVHHGNGTQDVLWDEGRCLFVSTHQWPLYPGSGAAEERGAHGQILNIPLRAGGGSAAMRRAYGQVVFPALRQYRPQLLLISAGFDAHENDPLGGLGWQTEDYAWLTRELCAIADAFAGGRVVSCLEGGYDLAALEASVRAHGAALAKEGQGQDER